MRSDAFFIYLSLPSMHLIYACHSHPSMFLIYACHSLPYMFLIYLCFFFESCLLFFYAFYLDKIAGQKKKASCFGIKAVRDRIKYSMDLSQLQIGQIAEVEKVEAAPALEARLRALNVSPGKTVRALRKAPFGGGIMLDAEGVRLALRLSLAKKIQIGLQEKES